MNISAQGSEPPMTPERFARLRRLFERASASPGGSIHDLLARECGDDADLRTRVVDLLRASEQAGSFLTPETGGIARQLLDLPPYDSPDGWDSLKDVGPYRLGKVIGRGGMGVVYLAEQSHPRREVALKILRSGADARAMQSRFGREIRLLGRLEHPGIARIYDAGVARTSVGPVSYFAMEYVRGQRITDYAARAMLDTVARVELIALVADAVQHAHIKGVIHRDLKPANILVAEAEETASDAAPLESLAGACPKILDFGVARLAEPEPGVEHTALTETGVLIGTVAYMSPEQLDGVNDAVDTRTDIYAMGVMLYELLTGRMPHDTKNKPIAEAARVVRDEEPIPLNAPATFGGTAAARFDRDLQTIVSRAMAKDRERRYATAAAFAEDLRRYLRSEPILARPPTAAYQLTKFARRHRGLVAGACAATFALVAGTVVSTSLYFKEQAAHRRADAKERLSDAVRGYLVDGLLMSASPERMGHEVKVLDVLTKAAEGLSDRFASEPEVEAGIRTELADVLGRVGKLPESLQQWDLAIPLLERLYGPDDRRTIAALLKQSGVVHQLKQNARGLSIAKEALTRARRSLPPGDPLVVAALTRIGAGRLAGGRPGQALPMLQEAMDLAQSAPVPDRAAILAIQGLIDSIGRNAKSADDAAASARQNALETEATLGPEHPSTINARSNLLLVLLRLGEVDEAVAIAEELPELAEKTHPDGHLMRGHVYRNSAEAMRMAGRFEDAERLALKGFATFLTALPDNGSEHEVCMAGLQRIYAQWPGHIDQLRDWSVRCAASLLQRVQPARWGSVRKLLGDASSMFATAGQPADRVQVLEMVWEQRETLAPKGTGTRAVFAANLARAFTELGSAAHTAELLKMAEEALPDAAGSQTRAQRAIERARSAVADP